MVLLSYLKNGKRRMSQRRGPKIHSRRYGIEHLEARQMLATGLSMVADNLVIDADPLGSEVHISGSGAWISVSHSVPSQASREARTASYRSESVNRIIFRGGESDDLFDNSSPLPCTARGYGGNDVLRGGSAADRLLGGDGLDELYGGYGNDFLSGQAGGDKLYGGSDHDRLYGGGGNDYLGAWITCMVVQETTA